MKRQTQKDRIMIKIQLADKFDQWRRTTNADLLKEVQKRAPGINGGERDELLKRLVMDHLDQID